MNNAAKNDQSGRVDDRRTLKGKASRVTTRKSQSSSSPRLQ